jgi:hypothetical protein
MAKCRLSDAAIRNAKHILSEGERILMRDYPLDFNNSVKCSTVITNVVSSLLNESRPPKHDDARIQAVLESIWMDMMEVLETPEARKEFEGYYNELNS